MPRIELSGKNDNSGKNDRNFRTGTNINNIDPTKNNLINVTEKEALAVSEGLVKATLALTCNYPFSKEEVSQAMLKIANIYVQIFKSVIEAPYIPITSFNVGATDEILTPDYMKFLVDSDLVQSIIDNNNDIEMTWRPAAYSKPIGKTHTLPISFGVNEFNTVVRNRSELDKILTGKVMNYSNSIIIYFNGLRKGVFKSLIKTVLTIMKYAKTFQANTAYNTTRVLTQEEIERDEIDLTYVKNADGSKVGVVYNPISASDGFSTYEEAEAAHKIRTLKLITELKRPGSGETESEKKHNNEEFIKAIQNYDFDLKTRNQEATCFNGSMCGAVSENVLPIFLSLINSELLVETFAGTFNMSALRMDLLSRAFFQNEIFSPEEIAADNALGENALGLGRVYGVVGDFTGEVPIASVALDNTKKDSKNGFVDIPKFNNPSKQKTYRYFNVICRMVLNPSKYIRIFMDPKPSLSENKKDIKFNIKVKKKKVEEIDNSEE